MSAQQKPGYRRRQWIVKPDYQLKITVAMVAFIIGVILFTLGLSYYSLWSTLRALNLEQEEVFSGVFRTAAWMVTFEFLIVIPALTVAAIVLTHRVVGPLARMHQALDDMARGKYDVKLVLRKNDVLIGLADAINRLAESLRNRSI